MNIPGNKLKDLIAVLQTLDPDLAHDIVNVKINEPAGRRRLEISLDRDKFLDLETFLDDLYEDLIMDDYSIAEDIQTIPQFKSALLSHLTKLHETIGDLQDKLDELQPSSV